MFRSPKLVAACALLLVATCGTAQAVTFSTFTNPHPPIVLTGAPSGGTVGFCYAGNKFVGTTLLYNGTGAMYSTDLNGGNVQVFAPSVNLSSTTGEHFVAASFGFGFGTSDIYVANGNTIERIANNGTYIGPFVSFTSGEVRGITFDLTGNYGNDMLVTTSIGKVYRVNSGGGVTSLANVGANVEGLDIAPASFGPYANQLIVAAESLGNFWAIAPGGGATLLMNGLNPLSVPSAEEITFVPSVIGANPLTGLYAANYPNTVLKASGSQFVGMEEDLIVTGETTLQVTRVHWDNMSSSFQLTNIGSLGLDLAEDGIFVTQTMIDHAVTPEPSSIVLGILGVGGLGVVAWRRRQPRTADHA